DRRFGCDVEYDRAEGRATPTAIGNAQHILDSSRRELPWNGEIAGFRHGRGLGSNVFQHKDVVRVDIELRVINAPCQIFRVFEHNDATLVFHQTWVSGGLLDDGAAGGQIAAQDRD